MNKTLFFHPINDFTGSTRVLSNIIETQYSDQNVTVITIDKHGFLSNIPNLNIKTIKYPSYNGKMIPILTPIVHRLYAVALTIFYGMKYNQFYINTILPYYAALVGLLYRKKIIYHIHEKFVNQSSETRIAEYIFNHVRAERIFVSKYLKKQYLDKPSCKSIVKYNLLTKYFLQQVDIRSIKLRKRNSIIMISSLTKAKGIFTFVEVAKLSPNFFFRLIISSDKKSLNTYMNQVFPLPSNIEILPVQENIHPFLREADLLLNLSDPTLCVESFGMTILEAMAYGIPAIVPNVGGPTELVEDGYNGFCIDVTNIDNVVSMINTIFEENNYYRFATNALSKVKLFM